MKISIDSKKCVGCFTCTVACSFHHTKAFSPEKASIRIVSDYDGVLHTSVLPTCDLCVQEKMPLCFEFCPVGAVKWTRDSSS